MAPRTRRGLVGLALPFVGRAVRAQLAGRQVAEPDRVPGRGVPRDRAAETDFEIVGMWAEHQQIDGHPVTLSGRALRICDLRLWIALIN